MKTLLIFLGLLVLAYLTWRLLSGGLRARARAHSPPMPDGLFLSPASQSAARAAGAMPAPPTEDASHLLTPPALPAQPERDDEEEREYFPLPTLEWALNVALPESASVTGQEVTALLTRNWRNQNGQPTLYAKSAASGRWTYLFTEDSPGRLAELAVAWRLHDSASEAQKPLQEHTLQAYLKSLEAAVKPLGSVTVTPSMTPAEAAVRSSELSEIVATWNLGAVIVVKAPAGASFDGKEIWDVMHCLGLRWGNMDLFHWPNNSADIGDDALFSVSTSTAPGYFLPELIARGAVKTEDLVFDFSIPRSAAPLEVLESMMAAAEYARDRLGGELQAPDGQRLDPKAMKRDLKSVVESLRSHGFEPGRDGTLFLF